MSEELTVTNESKDVQFIIEPSKRKTVRKVKVTVEGKLNLYNATFISESIKGLVEQYDILDFKLQNIAEIDMSALQTMYFYKTIYSQLEKSINFQTVDLPSEVNTIINKCKYNKVLFRKPTMTSK